MLDEGEGAFDKETGTVVELKMEGLGKTNSGSYV
jgi:hypothetical protein